ncbi:uncharacterized protein RJT20DRAFT_130643 [Scheffersomyces xylosifermentans]|uniref:uncharacterized protein n=1 Tax=Scheffersomyces xylosifermentans TaxID=1304137 RepID=UPI00315CD904
MDNYILYTSSDALGCSEPPSPAETMITTAQPEEFPPPTIGVDDTIIDGIDANLIDGAFLDDAFLNRFSVDFDGNIEARANRSNYNNTSLMYNQQPSSLHKRNIHPEFIYNKHDESIFDDERLFPSLHPFGNDNDELVKFDTNNPELINSATLKALIVQLTSPEVIDYNLICDFFLTYRIFVNGEQVMKLLLTRLIWSLQYINADDETNSTVGKLVLLRTFVVLRHWIINYFIDDFDSNPALCDLFATTMNKITIESNLVSKDVGEDAMMFEKKILGDLKIHWLNLVNEFWSLSVDIETLVANSSIMGYPLPSDVPDTKKLSKSNTEMSIHTNPSYRRSAMLSLYDQKAHHKILIFDALNSDDENPQFSINNLLLSHQSSRGSINTKIRELHIHQQSRRMKSSVSNSLSNQLLKTSMSSPDIALGSHKEQKEKKPLLSTSRHNHMNLKDSSLSLKKTSKEKKVRKFSNTHSNSSNDDNEDTETNNNNENENEVGSSIIMKSSTNTTSNYAANRTAYESDNDTDNTVYQPNITSNNPDSGRFENVGFSTNGNIKLPTSKVTTIVPPTPVKKMDYVLKSGQQKSHHMKSSITGSPTKKSKESPFARPPSKKFIVDGPETTEVVRKNSIKRLVDGWKKSMNHSKTFATRSNLSASPSMAELAASERAEELNKLINNAASMMSEEESASIIGNRVDILSARIIDELEYLIRYYVRNDSGPATIAEGDSSQEISPDLVAQEDSNDEFVDVTAEEDKGVDVDSNSIDVMGSPAKKPRISRAIETRAAMVGEIDGLSDDDDSDMDINDLSDLNIVKIDQLINIDDNTNGSKAKNLNSTDNLLREAPSQESSFQHPASINWNDAGNLDLENSAANDEDENEGVDGHFTSEPCQTPKMGKSGSEYFDAPSDPVPPIAQYSSQSNNTFDTSISTPSNLTQYDADVAELGIALSPQQNNQPKKAKLKRISFGDKNNAIPAVRRMSNMSRGSNGSVFKRDSVKSYLSYDSAFSISNGSRGSAKNEQEEDEFGLRKKNGYHDLRVLAGSPNEHNSAEERKSLDHPVRIQTTSTSMGSYVSRSSSVRKSIRFSNLCALTELPFSSGSEAVSILEKQNNSILQTESRSSDDLHDSSIFSVVMKSKKNSGKTTATNTGENGRSSTTSSAHSVAIPGISNYVLKELAAIPDESFQSENPVERALNKLEGKKSQLRLAAAAAASSSKSSSKDTMSTLTPSNDDKGKQQIQRSVEDDDDYFDLKLDNTEDILNQINNAQTEDAIEFTDFDITQEAPLTPIKNKKEMLSTKQNPITSTPNNDSIFYMNQSNFNSRSATPDFQSPKTILEKYSLSSNLLSVEHVMNNGSHISFVLSIDSTSLATHFTVIEKDMLQEIDWKELIELKWNKELTPVNSWLEIIVNDNYYNKNKGVNLVIARFNLMVNWVISEIILTKGQSERINIISRFIHIAQNCYVLQNYSTLMQIILGLTSEKVQSLRETWKNLSPGDILMLKNLEELASPLKNFLNIRLCINQMKPSKGCIPFVGLYLSDLVFNAERPTFIKKRDTSRDTRMTLTNPITFSAPSFPDDDTASSINSRNESEKVINFSKFRTSVHIVKSLSQCIEWSSNYKTEVNPEILSKCLYIKSLDEEEMNFCLECIEDA